MLQRRSVPSAALALALLGGAGSPLAAVEQVPGVLVFHNAIIGYYEVHIVSPLPDHNSLVESTDPSSGDIVIQLNGKTTHVPAKSFIKYWGSAGGYDEVTGSFMAAYLYGGHNHLATPSTATGGTTTAEVEGDYNVIDASHQAIFCYHIGGAHDTDIGAVSGPHLQEDPTAIPGVFAVVSNPWFKDLRIRSPRAQGNSVLVKGGVGGVTVTENGVTVTLAGTFNQIEYIGSWNGSDTVVFPASSGVYEMLYGRNNHLALDRGGPFTVYIGGDGNVVTTNGATGQVSVYGADESLGPGLRATIMGPAPTVATTPVDGTTTSGGSTTGGTTTGGATTSSGATGGSSSGGSGSSGGSATSGGGTAGGAAAGPTGSSGGGCGLGSGLGLLALAFALRSWRKRLEEP